jgi:hypothetical protein
MDAQPPALNLSGMLPDRLIAIKPPRSVSGLSALGMFSFLFLLACAVWSFVGADVLRDWRIGSDPVATRDARIDSTHCRSWLFVIAACSVSVTDAGGRSRTFRYGYVGEGEDAAQVLRSRDDPELVSTDLGLRHLYGRSLVFAVLAAVLLGAIGAVASGVHQANRTRQAFVALSGHRLTPMVVRIERNNALPPRRRVWIYRYPTETGSTAAMVELHTRERPLFVSKDERWAIAVRGPVGTVPMLLDGNLDTLDLAQEEKVTFLEKCRAELEKQGLI